MKPKPMKAEGQNMLLAARFGIDQLIRALRLKAPGIMGWGLKHHVKKKDWKGEFL